MKDYADWTEARAWIDDIIGARYGLEPPLPPALHRSPIDLPPRRCGDMEVRRTRIAGDQPILGFRQAMLRGLPPSEARIGRPLLIHELVGGGRSEGAVWMTDRPEELHQIAEAIHRMKPRGDVLVGGLGLGIMALALRAIPGVRTVTVVERSSDVVELCRPPGCEVVIADIRDHLLECRRYDHWLLDTWAGTGEGTWWSDVMPLRRIIARRFGRQSVDCWAEDMMIAQMVPAALSQGGRGWHYRCLPQNPGLALLRKFFRDVGLPAWERAHGEMIDSVIDGRSQR